MDDTTNPAASGGPPPSVDAQDPLPEASWFWRRVTTLSVLGVAALIDLGTFAALAWRGESEALLNLAHWNLAGAGLALLLYMAGANTSEITKLLQSSRLLQSGKVNFRSASSATSPDGATATTTTTLTPAPAPAPALDPLPPAGGPAPTDRADTVTFPWEKKQ